MTTEERLAAMEKQLTDIRMIIAQSLAQQIDIQADIAATQSGLFEIVRATDGDVDVFEAGLDERKAEALKGMMFAMEDLDPAVAAYLLQLNPGLMGPADPDGAH